MDEFINQIENILEQLSKLEKKYDFSLSEKYQGNAFPAQIELSVKMENLIHQVTHEMGTTIAFLKEDITKLHHYIEFRKKYYMLSDCELLFLIDDVGADLCIKKQINDKATPSSWLELRQAILKDWKSIFENMSFDKIGSKMKEV